MSATDRIVKEAVLRAPVERVWTALTDSKQFGAWFRAEFDGPFVAGRENNGRVTYPGYEHIRFVAWIERIEPRTLFSMRWHPCAIEPGRDYSAEPTTLVEFTLEPDGDGTRLRVVESGFDALPPDRRDFAFRSNDGGWAMQMDNVRQHVGG